jgi:hypothetical protein
MDFLVFVSLSESNQFVAAKDFSILGNDLLNFPFFTFENNMCWKETRVYFCGGQFCR